MMAHPWLENGKSSGILSPIQGKAACAPPLLNLVP